MKTINLVTGALFLALAVFIFVSSFFFKTTLIEESYLGASFFPRLVAACMAAFAAGLIAATLRSPGVPEEREPFFSRNMVRPLKVLALFVAYAALVGTAGFFVSTAALFSAVLAVFGDRKKTHYFIGALFVAAIEGLFVHAFKVPLPPGIVGF